MRALRIFRDPFATMVHTFMPQHHIRTFLLLLLLGCFYAASMPTSVKAQRRSFRNSRAPESWFSMRAGMWYLPHPGDISPEVGDAQGLEFNFRFGQTPLIGIAVNLSVWHSTYSHTRLQQIGTGETYEVYAYDGWSLAMPLEIGLAFTTPGARRAQAVATIGGGLIATVTKSKETRLDVPSDPTSETRNVFSPSVFISGEGAVNLSRSVGLVAVVTYRHAPLAAPLATFHDALSGVSLSGGFRIIL
jgi:hypothetical protein